MNGIKHDEKKWNAPRRIVVMYCSGWERGKHEFASYADCENYLKQEFGDETHIDLKDEEVEDAATATAMTRLCGNWKVCAAVFNAGEGASLSQEKQN